MVSKKKKSFFVWGWVKKSVSRDHFVWTLSKPDDAKRWSWGSICSSQWDIVKIYHECGILLEYIMSVRGPHTHDRFL